MEYIFLFSTFVILKRLIVCSSAKCDVAICLTKTKEISISCFKISSLAEDSGMYHWLYVFTLLQSQGDNKADEKNSSDFLDKFWQIFLNLSILRIHIHNVY